MVPQFQFSRELLDWLCLSNKRYTFDDIIKAMHLKCNTTPTDQKNSYIILDEVGQKIFKQPNKKVKLPIIMHLISKHIVVIQNRPKPLYFYYDYNQQPNDINIITL